MISLVTANEYLILLVGFAACCIIGAIGGIIALIRKK